MAFRFTGLRRTIVGIAWILCQTCQCRTITYGDFVELSLASSIHPGMGKGCHDHHSESREVTSDGVRERTASITGMDRHGRDGAGDGARCYRFNVDLLKVIGQSAGEGTGCELAVRLPLPTLGEPALAPVGSFVPTQRFSVPPAGTTVVIVEDNADSREMLCAMLTHTGLVRQHDAEDDHGWLKVTRWAIPLNARSSRHCVQARFDAHRRRRARPDFAGRRMIKTHAGQSTDDMTRQTSAAFRYSRLPQSNVPAHQGRRACRTLTHQLSCLEHAR